MSYRYIVDLQAEIEDLTSKRVLVIDDSKLSSQLKKAKVERAALMNDYRKLDSRYKFFMREKLLSDSCIVGQSEYVTSEGKQIGNSVFTAVGSKTNDDGHCLLKFEGVVVYMDHQTALSLGNEYLIKLRSGAYLDCQASALKGLCRASMVNTPRGLHHKTTKVPAKSNLRLVVNGDVAWLATGKYSVACNAEYFFGYGNGFRME
jgi:hypothetical protein